jgi:hypothetical protein
MTRLYRPRRRDSRERTQVHETRLLDRFAQSDDPRITLAFVSMPTDVQPGLYSVVPTKQHTIPRRVHDKGRTGDMESARPRPRIRRVDAFPQARNVDDISLSASKAIVDRPQQQGHLARHQESSAASSFAMNLCA